MRQTRIKLDWTQERLAEESGVNAATINQIERGRRSPKVATLERLATAMGVEVADFFPKVQAPLWSDDSSEERRALTVAETNAIETLSSVCDEIEGFLNDYIPRNRGTLSGTNLMTSIRLLARATAGLTLPYMESAAMRPAMLPTATRFVEIAHRLEREAKESGAGADEEAGNVIDMFERYALAS